MSNFSVVCGTKACNAKCPYCISSMTGACADTSQPEFDIPKFLKAIRYVERDVRDVLITGRGEPLLYPDHLDLIVGLLNEHFPNIELQTNGILYNSTPWEQLQTHGLNTVAVSVASLNDTMNCAIMGIRALQPQPLGNTVILTKFSVRDAIRTLARRFTVRVSYQLSLRDGPYYLTDEGQTLKVCSTGEWFYNTIEDAKKLGVQQITFRKIGKPDRSSNDKATEWVETYGDQRDYTEVLARLGKKLATYHWGGMIYDINGISVCLADCLTESPDTFEPRSWIFDGKNLRYSWQYEGAIIF